MESNVILAQPMAVDVTTVAPLGDSITQRCMSLAVIDSPEAAELAGEIIREAGAAKKQILAHIDPVCEQANKAHKAATGLRAKLLEFETHVKGLSSRLGAYLTEQRRKADEARRKAEAEARAEQERLRKEAEDAALAKAAELESQGKHFSAQVAMKQAEQPVVAPVAVAPTPAPVKVEGIHLRDNWKWRIVDEAAIPREWMQVNETLINSHVRNQKDKTKIAGIEVYNEPIPVNR